jgi:hypothetical protein
MNKTLMPSARKSENAWSSWLDRPLSGWWCAFGWLAATVVFMGLVRLCGGPSEGDLNESAYSTWAIAHGQIACAYPPATSFHFPPFTFPGPFIAPLWTMLSGAVGSMFPIGHGVSFPTHGALGSHCSRASEAMYKWSVASSAVASTIRLGYLGWLALMAGLIGLLRSSGRGRCGWEPVTLLFVACLPIVWMPLVQYFHPQDFLAVGLIFGTIACVRRGLWAWAGILIALAVMSQQFALLALAPLVMLAPSTQRAKFFGAGAVTAALILLPLTIITSGRVVRAMLLGSGNTNSYGGTVLWEMHFHGSILVFLSRVLPILLSILLARWSMRRLGPIALDPIPLISLIATSLSLRLVFEQNLFGYYFMALAVTLVALDIVNGRMRGQLVAWLALVVLAFSPVLGGLISNIVAWSYQEHEFAPLVFMAVTLVLIVLDARRGQIRGYLVASFILTALAFGTFPWASDPIRHALPIWFWQVILVASGVRLAVRPLMEIVRSRPILDQVRVEELTDAT